MSLKGTIAAAALTASLTIPAGGAGGAPADPPNILFVILDDVGVDQMKSFGFGGANPPDTANMDLIAEAGIKFTTSGACRSARRAGRPISPGVIRAARASGRRSSATTCRRATCRPSRRRCRASCAAPATRARWWANTTSATRRTRPAPAPRPRAASTPSSAPWIPARPRSTRRRAASIPRAHRPAATSRPTIRRLLYAGARRVGRLRGDRRIEQRAGHQPSRSCLQRGGVFAPNLTCTDARPAGLTFGRNNAYYVWPRTSIATQHSPYYADSCGKTVTSRRFMTEAQGDDGASWWNRQSGPRMLTCPSTACTHPSRRRRPRWFRIRSTAPPPATAWRPSVSS